MAVYYNECDEQKAAWIRELIKRNVVAPGDVDERSITDVQPDDLRGYTQCHFFAGIAVWSYALRLAGWPDDRPVWTGSCPCPSFSAAGKGLGFTDPRHLWPDWFRLIRECRPAVIFGEQVEAAIGHGWLDLVQTDLESAAYAVGSAVLTAAGVGAPHIRARLYFCAHAEHEINAVAHRRDGLGRSSDAGSGSDAERRPAERQRLDVGAAPGITESEAQERQWIRDDVGASDEFGECADPEHDGRDRPRRPATEPDSDQSQVGIPDGDCQRDLAQCKRLEGQQRDERNGNRPGWLSADEARSVAAAGATRGFWSNCDWWYGRDGKYRPIEPGILPLAHGAAERVVRLRGYGDAIVAPVAQAFIESVMEIP